MSPAPDPPQLPLELTELLRRPKRFSFYQAIRLLERLSGGVPLGRADLPRREAVRIRGFDSLAFPGSDVTAVFYEPNPWERPQFRYVLCASFMGLYGPASPLPTVYTELIIRPQGDEEPEDRERLRDFLDLFHHRFFSFFYRVLSKYRYYLVYEQGGKDVFTGYMLSLIGRGTQGLREKRAVSEVALIRYAGLLTHSPRSAGGLQGLLGDYLTDLDVHVEQCTGRWLRVEDRNALGGAFCGLGQDMIVGSSVYDRTGKIRISVGPMGLYEFMRFLPTGKTMAELRELVRLYLVDDLEFDVEVKLRGDEVPSAQLGMGAGAMLGWTSWPQTGPGPDRSVVFQG